MKQRSVSYNLFFIIHPLFHLESKELEILLNSSRKSSTDVTIYKFSIFLNFTFVNFVYATYYRWTGQSRDCMGTNQIPIEVPIYNNSEITAVSVEQIAIRLQL